MKRLLLFSGLASACTVDFGAARSPDGSENPKEVYAQTCADKIAELPTFDCMQWDTLPMKVDGAIPETYVPDMRCDTPMLASPGDRPNDGFCVPYSRAFTLRDDATVQAAVFCRRWLIRGEDDPLFDEIDIVLHSPETGDTCFFQASKPNPDKDPSVGVDGRAVPSPTSTKADDLAFWNDPRDVGKEDCGGCHDNDPFYYSPLIAQRPEALPADPFGPYHFTANELTGWPQPVVVDTPGNTCTGCHRIGNQHTCAQGLDESIGLVPEHLSEWARAYPHSHWMPLDNPRTLEAWKQAEETSIEKLRTCCTNADGLPECQLTSTRFAQ